MSKWKRKRDANHSQIQRLWQGLGWQVIDTALVGPNAVPGFPDLMCVRDGLVVLCEVKTQEGVLSRDEEAFLYSYDGLWCVVREAKEVLTISEWLRRQLYLLHTPHGGEDDEQLTMESLMDRCRGFLSRYRGVEETASTTPR